MRKATRAGRLPCRVGLSFVCVPMFLLAFAPVAPVPTGDERRRVTMGAGPAGVPRCTALDTTSGPVPDYYAFELTSTAQGLRGSGGQVVVSFAPSPFVVAVTSAGDYIYRVDVTAQGLPPLQSGVYVAWAATPDLSQVTRLGSMGSDRAVTGEVPYNKFLAFVTREASADQNRWTGPIVLRGIARSGLMHSMRGHGPFTVETC